MKVDGTHFLTLGEVAKRFTGVATWQVRRLYERRILSEPPRFFGVRAVPEKDLAKIGKALKAHGYLDGKSRRGRPKKLVA